MRITDVKTTMVAVPLARFGEYQPVRMWYATRWASLHCITVIETDEGITGIASEGKQDIIMNVIRPFILGKDPFDVEVIENELMGRKREIDMRTLSALDGGLWDIIGKACGQPLFKLWGGKVNPHVHVRYWLDCQDPEEQALEAQKAVSLGWKAFKIKGGTHPDVDVERLKAVRQAVGDSVQLCVDLNGSYPLHVAINTLKKMAKYGPSFVEEPVKCVWPYDAGCIDNLADIRRMTGVPIELHCVGPNCQEFAMAVVSRRAADAIHLNVTFAGSIIECRRVCAIAEAGGIIVTGQSNAAELGPRNALMLHLITSERAFRSTNDNSTHLLEAPSGDIIKKEFHITNGVLEAPAGPGLGVELDPQKIEHYEELYKSGKYAHEAGLGRKDPYLWS